MEIITPNKLKPGDKIRVIAPARTYNILGQDANEISNQRLHDLGFEVTFGKHIKEDDDFRSTSVESRLDDLLEAFSDKSVAGILAVIGGFNSNQLLQYIDYELIKANPKPMCGYSDITALTNAIFAKTGLVGYSGPHYSSFGQKLHFEYTLEYFRKCLMTDNPYEIIPCDYWTDDAWYVNQDDRQKIPSAGFVCINEGETQGTIIGGNLCTLNLLQGTQFMPSLKDAVVFLEDDCCSNPVTFDRDLQSLLHQPDFSGVKGLVIGMFQKKSEFSIDLLTKIIKSKKELQNIPVIANANFGHIDPKFTFPVGGKAQIVSNPSQCRIVVLEH